jgi:hypothetical protein
MNQEPAVINDAHLATACHPGKGETTCAYLTFGPGGWCCAKKSDLQQMIELKLAAGTIRAKGNNCSGPPHFEIRS